MLSDRFLSAALADPTAALRELDRRDAEERLADFVRQAWRYADPATYVHGWHVDAICEHLEAVSRGEIHRLIINVPPRHQKSLTVSVFYPAWDWINRPQRQWLFVSHAHALSIRDNVKCRRVIESPWYRRNWGDRFRLTSDQNTKIRFENDRGGYRIASSTDAVTGDGGDIVVVDDPQNVRDAESEAVREATLTWWNEAMPTRINDMKKGAFVIIMQRLHERDLTGHILARETGWDHLCLPARFEAGHPHPIRSTLGFHDPRSEGELLWPERFGEVEIQRLQASLGSYASAGQLQQRPAPREGGMFSRRYFEVVRAVPADVTRVRYWDLAATEESVKADPAWTAGLRLARDRQGIFYIENVVRMRESAHKVEAAIKNIASQDGVDTAIGLPQDPGQAGKAQSQYLIRQLAGYKVTARPETGDKTTRAGPVSAQAEAGNIKIVEGDWNEAFLDEAETFPNGAYKDQIDALSGAFDRLAGVRPTAAPPPLFAFAGDIHP